MSKSETTGLVARIDALEGRLNALSAILHLSMAVADGATSGHLHSVNRFLMELADSGDIDGGAVLHEFRKIIGQSA